MPKMSDFQAGLFPARSPLLRESLLFGFGSAWTDRTAGQTEDQLGGCDGGMGRIERWMMGSFLLDVCLSQQRSVDGEWTEDGTRLTCYVSLPSWIDGWNR
ncbi:hypothetical protein YC2023_019573 [Brassica napus]